MKHDPIGSGKRKPVNVSLDTGIVAAAREAGINLSRVSEAALRTATREAQAQQWLEQNREALAEWNRWYDTHGDPLAHLDPL